MCVLCSSVFEDAGWRRDDRQWPENQVQPTLEQNPVWRTLQAPSHRYTHTNTHELSHPLLTIAIHSSSFLPPSFLLSGTIPLFSLPEGANFRNILDKAVQADQVVGDRYTTHCDMIALLCKPENELNAAIPSANPTKTLQGNEVRQLSPDVSMFVCLFVWRPLM